MSITCNTCGQPLPVDESTFGGRLLKAINDSGRTREEVAEVAGHASTHQVSRWINGNGKPKDIEVVEKVARVLGVTPGWLLWGVQEPELPFQVPMPSHDVDPMDIPDDVPQVNPIRQMARDAGIDA